MRKIVIGALAHVDAGKTTLTEALLFEGGRIKKLGRVDKQNAFLDTNLMEKERGITIFSKQAVFSYEDLEITLVDTPGHVDFAPEMERTLQILDYAILVINGAEGIQAHTRTLWSLLSRYGIPVFLFVNKMDQVTAEKDKILESLKNEFTDACIDFSDSYDNVQEQIAVTEESVLEEFLEKGQISAETVCRVIKERKLFPCFFGSALKMTGIREFLQGLSQYIKESVYPDTFGAKVFKIMRDSQGNRLTCLKVTGGVLKVKSSVTEDSQEKINQIRIYSGEKYDLVQEAVAGTICAVTGLNHTKSGQGLGYEAVSEMPVLEPVLTYSVILPEGTDAAVMLPKLRQLEEEEPLLHVIWDEVLQEIQVCIMGEVQLEILKRMIRERFSVDVNFGQGNVIYKETISQPVLGVGHFEPLKHYAEVHVLLEPTEQGSGMSYSTSCSEDILSKNWQRLILSHLEEKEHKGVLKGAGLTDVHITLVAGRAHIKHTEGGDFRQAAYRAVRQGLMKAESVLLEPYYAFTITVPEKLIGRAMNDVEKRYGSFTQPQILDHTAVLTGQAPVITMRDYQKEITAYTQGEGHISCSLKGYFPCHNTEEVLANAQYNPEGDLENPSGSVFCAHGAGYTVPWYEADEHMHVALDIGLDNFPEMDSDIMDTSGVSYVDFPRREHGAYDREERVIGQDEIERILERTYHANKREKGEPRKGIYKRRVEYSKDMEPVYTGNSKAGKRDEYLLVDGYNIIHAWEELKQISEITMDGARGRLLDILCDYQAQRGCCLIVVFDAYRVKGHDTESVKYHNINVVYTKEAETADRYIERFAHENGRKYRVIVATSDGVEQVIIRGQGCELLSARDFEKEVQSAKNALRESYLEQKPLSGLKTQLSHKVREALEGDSPISPQ